MDNQGLHIACTLMIRTHQPSGPTYIECNGSILFANFHILHILEYFSALRADYVF